MGDGQVSWDVPEAQPYTAAASLSATMASAAVVQRADVAEMHQKALSILSAITERRISDRIR